MEIKAEVLAVDVVVGLVVDIVAVWVVDAADAAAVLLAAKKTKSLCYCNTRTKSASKRTTPCPACPFGSGPLKPGAGYIGSSFGVSALLKWVSAPTRRLDRAFENWQLAVTRAQALWEVHGGHLLEKMIPTLALELNTILHRRIGSGHAVVASCAFHTLAAKSCHGPGPLQ